MKYKFEGCQEIRTSNVEEIGDIANAILMEMFGENPPCTFQLVCKENDVYVLKKNYRDLHSYTAKTCVKKKLKRRWHPTKDRVFRPRKYYKYLKP